MKISTAIFHSTIHINPDQQRDVFLIRNFFSKQENHVKRIYKSLHQRMNVGTKSI